MSLSNFLHFNSNCPLCDNPLTLYMQWIDAPCFKSKKIDNNTYEFYQFKNLVVSSRKEFPYQIQSEDTVTLIDHGNDIEIQFDMRRLRHHAKKYQIYFFFLCDEAGFQDKGLRDYEINLTKGHYYRSTILMGFKEIDKEWKLLPLAFEKESLINKDEAFSFSTKEELSEKVYMLNMDAEKQKTSLWYYSITEEEKLIPNFKPKIFISEPLPYIKRPDLSSSQRQKLINRLNSWIILS